MSVLSFVHRDCKVPVTITFPSAKTIMQAFKDNPSTSSYEVDEVKKIAQCFADKTYHLCRIRAELLKVNYKPGSFYLMDFTNVLVNATCKALIEEAPAIVVPRTNSWKSPTNTNEITQGVAELSLKTEQQ